MKKMDDVTKMIEDYEKTVTLDKKGAKKARITPSMKKAPIISNRCYVTI